MCSRKPWRHTPDGFWIDDSHLGFGDMNLSLFMSRRLLKGENRKQISHGAVVISTVGIALGVAVMIITLSIVLGFQREVREKVVSFGSHVQLLNYNTYYRGDMHPIQVNGQLIGELSGIPGVASVSRFTAKSGVLKTDDAFQGVSFRGFDEHYDLSFLQHSLLEGQITEPFSSKKSTGRLYVSKRVAKQLKLEVGQKVYAYFFEDRLRTRRFTIAGIYQSGLNDFDKSFVFCDYATVHQLLKFEQDQCSGAEIRLTDFSLADSVSNAIAMRMQSRLDAYGQGYASPSIQRLYPGIFSWLNLLDINVIVIFSLMALVAGFSSVSGLLIIILERVQFIGVMKALGASNGVLRSIFSSYSFLIALRGILLGNAVGIGLCLLQDAFGLVRLNPEVYYVEAVPVLMHWPLILLMNVVVALLVFIALLLPTLQVSRIEPAKSIRFE